jgi:hypothetical protein
MGSTTVQAKRPHHEKNAPGHQKASSAPQVTTPDKRFTRWAQTKPAKYILLQTRKKCFANDIEHFGRKALEMFGV